MAREEPDALETGPLQLTIPFDLNRTNRNRIGGANRYKQARVFAKAREMARLVWIAAGKPVARRKVRLSVIVRRRRVLDDNSVWIAAKPLIDGVFVNALTPDDGPRWLELGAVTQETGRQWVNREEVVFIIEPAPA